MGYCIKETFNNTHSPSLVSILSSATRKNKGKGVDVVYGAIINALKSDAVAFEFGDKTNKTQKYLKSIPLLQQTLTGLIEKWRDVLQKSVDVDSLLKTINENFITDSGLNAEDIKTETDPEEPEIENLEDFPNEKDRLSQKLRDIVEDYYGTVIKANDYRVEQFGRDISKVTVIDVDNRRLIRTRADLNDAICDIKNRYFKNIVNYLKSINPNYNFGEELYNEDGELQKGYLQVLNQFYNELKKVKDEGLKIDQENRTLEDLVTEGWRKRLNGYSDSFYDALNSYVNLIYFDDMLKDAVGRSIELSDSGLNNVEMDSSFLKYRFAKDDEHKVKGWETSDDKNNALDHIGKFSKLAISTIPIYSTTENKFLNRYCSIGSFTRAKEDLFVNVDRLSNAITLQKAIKNFHNDPQVYSKIIFQEILKPEMAYKLKAAGINDFNLNILTSVAKYVFDLNNENSIRRIEIEALKNSFTINGYSVVDAITGVMDRTMDSTYTQAVYSKESNMVEVTTKKKGAARKGQYNVINRINSEYDSITKNDALRKALCDKYQLIDEDMSIEESKRLGRHDCHTYSIKVGDFYITGTTKNDMGILSSKPIKITFSNPRLNTIFDQKDSTIDLISESSINRILQLGNNPSALSSDEKLFRDTIQLIDDYLGTDFLSKDGLTKLLFYKGYDANKNLYIEEILGSVFRTAVVNDLYHRFNVKLKEGKYPNKMYFTEFLKSSDGYLPFRNLNFNSYEKYKNFLSNTLGIPKLISVRTSDSWIDNLADIESQINGDISKSTTNDINNNKIANSRVSFLGGNIKYYLSQYQKAEQEQNGQATTPLLFTENNGLIAQTVLNQDAQSRTGIKKSVKDMKASELFYSSIIQNFYGNYLQSKLNSDKFGNTKNKLHETILIQPTTYSDKTSFITYAIKANKKIKAPNKSYDNKSIWEMSSDNLIDLYQDTVGQAYINSYNNILNDLKNVMGKPDASLEEVNSWLNTVSEEQLLSLADSKGISLILDTHYRKNGEHCKFNELLYHYATNLYADRNSLVNRFKREQFNFLNDLLSSGVNFYVSYFDDNDPNIRKGITSNPISRIIDEVFSKKEMIEGSTTVTKNEHYRNNWIYHNKLILAKVNGANIYQGSEIEYNENDTIELNPLLEKYFFTDTLLANNLRFELTGSEIAHPDKAKINYTSELLKLGINPQNSPQYFKFFTTGTNFEFNKVNTNDIKTTKISDTEIQLSTDEGNAVLTTDGIGNYTLDGTNLNGVLIKNIINVLPMGAKLSYSDNIKQNIIQEFNKNLYALDGNIYQKYEAKDNFKDLIWVKQHSDLKPLYDKVITKIEAVAQGTQLKRNVIIPATLQYIQQNVLNGVPAKMKVAVIKDTQAKIFNFRGDSDTEDAHDGSAYINPFVSILENRGLQDQEVGVDKKPIWHSYDTRTMSATLLKFATFTITNERMRTSLNSDIKLYDLFKQMTNLQWTTVGEDGQVTWNNDKGVPFDLVNSKGYKKNGFTKIDFYQDILAGRELFYEENGSYYRIVDFGLDEFGYYTKEFAVNISGDRVSSGDPVKVYHRFDADSNHLKFRGISPKVKGTHNINSLFELFNVLGGIYSMERVLDDNDTNVLKYSDVSSYAVVGFMNNVTIRQENADSDIMSQSTYYQPLKDMMISYAANQSAVKNGTANINGVEAWKGQTKLRYMTLNSNGLGIQMDADHDIDDAQMTEFTQVISALEAGGRLHGISKQVYRTLGYLCTKASEEEINAAVKYIRAKSNDLPTIAIKSEMYDIIGKTLLNNYKQRVDQVDLATPIVQEIKKRFNLTSDHTLDNLKLPLSDSNLFTQIIPTFISNLNKKSVKRKFPGSGCVMVPGYGIIQIFKYNGNEEQFDDVLKKARQLQRKESFFRDFDPSKESIAIYNKNLVAAYLHTFQEKEWKKATFDNTKFQPTDIVDILINGEYATTLRLDDPYNYYAFEGRTNNDITGVYRKETTRNFIQKLIGRQLNPEDDISYAVNVTQARDLAPARISFEYDEDKAPNDAILGKQTDNEFGSDVAVILNNKKENVHFLGTTQDIEQFKNWFALQQQSETPNLESISQNTLDQVRVVMQQNPELATTLQEINATNEDYAQYIRSIYPNSVEKDIYWHGSNSDYSRGFDSAVKTKGSGAPEVGDEFYVAKQPYSIIQYVDGQNRTGQDVEGFAHWNKLYWELKEIMSNGRRQNNDWKDLTIDEKNVRQEIPNKKGELDLKNGHGKTLKERKARYGYQDKTDEEFFKDIFGIEYGKDTFNTWVERNREIFKKKLEDGKVPGIYAVVINTVNPIVERGKNTYYEEERGLKTLAKATTHRVSTNVFLTEPVVQSFLNREDSNFNATQNRREIQKMFDELEKGFYKGRKIYNLKNEAAELVISNMYASKYNTSGRSLAELKSFGANYFKPRRITPIISKHYDMAFTTGSGKHTYITFKTPKVDPENVFKPRNIGWKYTLEKNNEVYATTKDNQILFKVGKNIKTKDIVYQKGKFYSAKDNTEIVDPELRYYKGAVYRYKEYVSNYQIVEVKGNHPITYNLRHFNIQNMLSAFGKDTGFTDSEEYQKLDKDQKVKALRDKLMNDVYKQIGSIMTKMYYENNYNGIRLNDSMYTSSADHIKSIIPHINITGKAGEFLNETLEEYLKPAKIKNDHINIDTKKYNAALVNYYSQFAEEVYSSFLKSLYFTAARIPAQTLQSFMQMKAVAFTQSSKNICYVSHWQTWLQGSDY